MTAEIDLTELAMHRGATSALVAPRRHLLTRVVVPAVLLVGFCGLAAWSAQDILFPPQEVTVVPVYAAQGAARHEGAPLFKAAGWIEPRPTAIRVAALAPGVVETLMVVEDQAVTTGQPIAELVKVDAELALQQANAELTLRQAELEQARAALEAATIRFERPVHLQAPLAEAEAALAKIDSQLKNLPFEIRAAQAQVQYARKNYEGKSAAEGVLSERIVDQARSELAAAEALFAGLQRKTESLTHEQAMLASQCDALQAVLKLKTEETLARQTAEARVKMAAAGVHQAEIAIAQAKLRLERMTIRAPADGRILQLLATPGARLMDGANGSGGSDASTVVTMYQPDNLQVRVDVRFEDIPKVGLHQPVLIECPALADPITGNVLFIGSEANIQKNTLQVKVAIDDPPPVFRPEMLVDATFLAATSASSTNTSTPHDVMQIHIPQSLVKHDGRGSFVWLADQSEGIARQVYIEIGTNTFNGLVEVTRGLNNSSRVIASNAEELTDGARIRVSGEMPIPDPSSFTMSRDTSVSSSSAPVLSTGHHQ